MKFSLKRNLDLFLMESLSEIILFMENQLSIMSSSVHEDCLFIIEISKLKV